MPLWVSLVERDALGARCVSTSPGSAGRVAAGGRDQLHLKTVVPLTHNGPAAGAVPARTEIVVSTLFYYKEEIADQFVATLWPQLRHAAAALPADVVLVITLNFPFTRDLWDGLAATYPEEQGVRLHLVRRGFNLGFGASHREVFAAHRSDVFIAMNNDLFCERLDWIAAFASALGPLGKADLVGAIENQTALRDSDACGIPVGPQQTADFVDGSLLGFRSGTARRVGLFSDAYRFFYFEDSDVVLRYRQHNLVIETVAVPHQHFRWSSSRQLPRHVVENILDLNRGTFWARWQRYLQDNRHRFTGRGLIDLREMQRVEELVEAVPAVLALTIDHPGLRWRLLVRPGLPVEVFTHPMVEVVAVDATRLVPAQNWDRVWQPRRVVPTGGMPAALMHLREVAGKLHLEALAEHWRRVLTAVQGPLPLSPTETRRALISVQRRSAHQVGFELPADWVTAMAAALESEFAVEVLEWTEEPLPTTAGAGWAQAMEAVARADVVVTSAGAVAEWAQAWAKQTFVLVGARLLDTVIWNWQHASGWQATDLECIGCEQVWGAPGRSYCLRQDVACLDASRGPVVIRQLQRFLADGPSALAPVLEASQRLRLATRRHSEELDLSGWPD